MEKYQEYTQAILSKVAELFAETEEQDAIISEKELFEGENLTYFFHALSNMVPSLLYNHFTKQEIDPLQFNHIANTLVFQYGQKEKDTKDGEDK